jgi:hypothetical protein
MMNSILRQTDVCPGQELRQARNAVRHASKILGVKGATLHWASSAKLDLSTALHLRALTINVVYARAAASTLSPINERH